MLVAMPDRMVFPIDEKTLEPLSVSYYDAYIFSEPPDDVVISYDEYLRRLDVRFRKKIMKYG